MAEMKSLLENIEILRQTMENLGLVKGFDDPDVIALSQKLDALLNEYYKNLYLRTSSVA
jgi:hypothetical protein